MEQSAKNHEPRGGQQEGLRDPVCGMALEPVSFELPTTTEWVCPMHPEIVRSEPGSCPICGMALEPKGVVLTDGPDPELVEMTWRARAPLSRRITLRCRLKPLGTDVHS